MRSCFYLFLKMERFNTSIHLDADGKEPADKVDDGDDDGVCVLFAQGPVHRLRD